MMLWCSRYATIDTIPSGSFIWLQDESQDFEGMSEECLGSNSRLCTKTLYYFSLLDRIPISIKGGIEELFGRVMEMELNAICSKVIDTLL